MFRHVTKGTIAIVCVFLAIFFTSLAFPNFERVHWYRQIVMTVVSPPQKLITGVSGFFRNTWNHYIALANKAAENDRLKAKLAEIESMVISLEETKRENERLREMVSMSGRLKRDGIGAKVIASNVLAEFKTVTIDKGADDGLRKNMAVIGPGGLVGKIGQIVSSGEAIVMLISDPNSSADVFVGNGEARAILVGTSGSASIRPFYSLSRLEYLKKTSGVKTGDVVITSGLDRLFPAGIPVGTITSVEETSGIFKNAEVVPFVDLSRLKEVVVLK